MAPGIGHYLELFRQCVLDDDAQILKQKNLETATGKYKDAVFLKLYKKEWANPFSDPLTAESRIFFSVWVTPQSVAEKKIWYNIHALKLRKLTGYRIGSREFADRFRSRFVKYQQQWPNLQTDFGPLTLFEGWDHFDEGSFVKKTRSLLIQFTAIEGLIDETLAIFRK